MPGIFGAVSPAGPQAGAVPFQHLAGRPPGPPAPPVRLPRRADGAAAAALLAFEHALGWRTIARGVRALPPASIARFEDGTLHLSRYWTPHYRAGRGTLADHTDELGRRFGGAVRRAFEGPGRV